MKLKVQHILDATPIVTAIINENRPLPQKGKYRLARLHAKLSPEFDTANAHRDAMITAYGHRPMVDVKNAAGGVEGSAEASFFAVPADKLNEFNENWKKIADDEIEVDAQPVPVDCLDLGGDHVGSITAVEFAILASLVSE